MTPVHAAAMFASLLVIVNPVALAPVFGALTRGMDCGRSRRTAAVAVAAGFALLAAAGLAGHALLTALGAEKALVHLVVATALMVVGVAMLAGRAAPVAAGPTARDPALVPLAVPLIAGPGAIGAMVMFSGKADGQPGAIATLYAALAVVAGLTFAAFLAAAPITRRLGVRGVALITRGLGALLVVVAARFFVIAAHDFGLIGAAGAAP
jgi:multiple antibiotic resistance protein